MPPQSLDPPQRFVVFAVATFDTKAEELAWVATCLRQAKVDVVTVDVSAAREADAAADVSVSEVLAASGLTLSDVQSRDRGAAVTTMSDAFRIWLLQQHAKGRVAGVIGIGGSGGTAIITTGMRGLPVGIPKLMVSTMASGNTAPYVDCSDICLMPSIVDVAGLNTVSRRVLSNAAHAMAGMVTHVVADSIVRPAIGMTMFGVTTACVTAVRKSLEDAGFDCLVFHATGTGGRAMETLVESGLIEGVLDVTTTEVADEVVGGILSAGPQRFDVILQKQIPYVMSLGALDMVNFGAKATVPDRFRDRTLHVHNANVTLMRTTADENRQIAEWIAAKLNQASSAVTLLIPEQGFSAIDAAGQAFHDPTADTALFEQLESRVEQSELRRIVRFPLHINDPEFATALVAEFQRLWAMRRT
ncbi:MAG: Tm-1-like ATP-binding domain-containing protein [Planctomycetales bacterium]|nr:Tm-1-like ATP-binding domain-containing protein [Planctomycetales bacterium]